MQVIFIHHSCFLVEVDDLVLIFDYFGKDSRLRTGFKNLYVCQPQTSGSF